MGRGALTRRTRAALAAVDAAFGSPADASDASDAEFEAVVDADSLLAAVYGAFGKSGMATGGLLSGKDYARALLRRDDLSLDQRSAVTELLSILNEW